jgi:hypothetical protein
MSIERRVRGLCFVLLWSADDEAILRLLPRFRKAVLELEEKIRLQQRGNGRGQDYKRCA